MDVGAYTTCAGYFVDLLITQEKIVLVQIALRNEFLFVSTNQQFHTYPYYLTYYNLLQFVYDSDV